MPHGVCLSCFKKGEKADREITRYGCMSEQRQWGQERDIQRERDILVHFSASEMFVTRFQTYATAHE
jgi:hypothetical protein